jgi:DNA end-binding protein Ku
MAARSAWKGFLKLSLVSVPVKAYTATASEAGEIKLNQLHKDCNSRINYKKTCAIHGELGSDQIVSGYEYSKGQFVVIDTDELEKLRTEDDKAIKIDVFVPPDTIDPMYFTGKTYYLVPDGPMGQKSYGVVHQAMVDANRWAVAQVVMHSREQLVVLRPVENLLAMSILSLEPQIAKPAAFGDEAPKVDATAEERSLAKMLIASATPKKMTSRSTRTPTRRS